MKTLDLVHEQLFKNQLIEKRVQTGLKISKLFAYGAIGMAIAQIILFFATGLDHFQLIVSSISLICGSIALLIYPYMLKKDKARLGSYIAVIGLLVSFFIALLVLPEIIILAALFYVIVFCLGMLLLGTEAVGWLTLLVASAFLANLISNHTGLISKLFTPMDNLVMINWAIYIISTLALALVAVIINFMMKGQEEQFRSSFESRIVIERQGKADSEARTYLQETVNRYIEYLEGVSRGNLAARLTLDGKNIIENDPMIMLGHNINEMTGSLQRMIGQIQESAVSLSSASAEILAATTQQAAGASEQSAAISETTTTVDEVKAISEQASLRIQEVANASQRTVETAKTGQKALQETIESMGMIKERVEGIAENILALSDQTQQIGDIIATVNEIASQSNMLALNASVEAARAGEHGKGFAVVAMEVRNLAEQSRQATAQVKVILSEIQKATNSTVMATEEGTKGVERGVQLSAQAREAIEQLSAVINESAQIATQVVAGGRQQQTGVEQIALAMQNINQATIQSLASTRQAEKSAQNLNDLALKMNETVAMYKN